MKTIIYIKKALILAFVGIYLSSNMALVPIYASGDNIVSPFKKVSKLDCRFQDYSELGSDCLQTLPKLSPKDYKKYATLNGGYNEYTRYYTVLRGASYKYGWDVGNGGHLGTDIATAKGTPIHSMADGTVILAKTDLSWGKFVTVEHTIRGKKVYSSYAHMSKILVKKGQKVKAGQKIGEVGSTGNSTGNHLHFQIDLDTPFHPYYPDYKTCPYSYYEITEKGVCLDQIEQSTIDPLLFLETKGKILDDIKIITPKISRTYISSNNKASAKNTNTSEDLSIFDRTVYVGYSSADIKKVQEIFKELGEYNGKITGNYEDIEQDIISYQLAKGIISSRDEYGAGRFGPKTRTQAKKDYLAMGGKSLKTSSKTVYKKTVPKITKRTQVISRDKLLTREQIEAREIKDFLKYYKIDIDLAKIGNNISVGETVKLKIKIIKKGKNTAFKGNTPLDITFGVDEKILSVFPKKIYNFAGQAREIKLTGKKSGNIVLSVKMGSQIIKTFKIKVYSKDKVVYPSKAIILGAKKSVIGEVKKAIGVLKDEKNKNLINIEYGSTFTLKGEGGAKVCMKTGSIRNIKKIYTKTCDESDFKDSISFSYKDTVGGLVLFDYKASSKNAKIKIVNNYNSKVLASNSLYITNPKGLDKRYVYYEDVIKMLENQIATGVKNGYFMEKRSLSSYDALVWVENTLKTFDKNSSNSSIKSKIPSRLSQIKKDKQKASRYNSITRKQFLELTYKYLNFNNLVNSDYKKYRDLDDSISRKLVIAFDSKTTWKDKFGESYFRPEQKLTRGEAAYFLNKISQKQLQVYLVNR